MTLPIWLKPGLMGAAVGAIALAVVGFSWGGWVTSSSAAEMADEQAEDTLVAALVPFCVSSQARNSEVWSFSTALLCFNIHALTNLLTATGVDQR